MNHTKFTNLQGNARDERSRSTKYKTSVFTKQGRSHRADRLSVARGFKKRRRGKKKKTSNEPSGTHTHMKLKTGGDRKADLPARSRERCTQKVCRPPFLQTACSTAVEEEKRRTLLKMFKSGKRQKKKKSEKACARPPGASTKAVLLLWSYPSSVQEAGLKISPAEKKTHTRMHARARTHTIQRSFPSDTSFTLEPSD